MHTFWGSPIEPGTGARARINYLLNWMLFVLVVPEIASGVAISQVALPAIGVSTINDRAWRALHNGALNYSLLLIGLHVAIAGAVFLSLGPPAMVREYHVKSEVARFAPTVGHGLLQFGGETFLLILVAYVGRRWLRVRL